MTMGILHGHRLTSRLGTKRRSTAGLTLIELTVVIGILLVLSTAAIPVAQMTIHRQREAELRRDLREMRDAIDRYKDAADKNLIRTEVGSQGYPPDLDTLVSGVDIAVGGNVGGISAAALAAASQNGGSIATAASDLPTKVRFLRRVPVDPMTGKSDWGLRAIQDDADSHSWGGHNVFDVYTQSQGTAINGTKYEDW
jgi:general secretion pathway protein G